MLFPQFHTGTHMKPRSFVNVNRYFHDIIPFLVNPSKIHQAIYAFPENKNKETIE